MVVKKSIVRKNLSAVDQDFDIDSVYKGMKKKADDLGYGFLEQEQTTKEGKYGTELTFKFKLVKDIDFFGRSIIEIEFKFDLLNKVKGREHGDCGVEVKSEIELDYQNRWGKNKFNKALFGLYSKIKAEDFKRLYLIPTIKNTTEVQEFIKDKFGFYVA